MRRRCGIAIVTAIVVGCGCGGVGVGVEGAQSEKFAGDLSEGQECIIALQRIIAAIAAVRIRAWCSRATATATCSDREGGHLNPAPRILKKGILLSPAARPEGCVFFPASFLVANRRSSPFFLFYLLPVTCCLFRCSLVTFGCSDQVHASGLS